MLHVRSRVQLKFNILGYWGLGAKRGISVGPTQGVATVVSARYAVQSEAVKIQCNLSPNSESIVVKKDEGTFITASGISGKLRVY